MPRKTSERPQHTERSPELKKKHAEHERLSKKIQHLFENGLAHVERSGELPADQLPGSAFDATNTLRNVLECPDSDRIITETERERAFLFFETLRGFINEKRRDPKTREHLETYLNRIRETWFSVSPSLVNSMSLEDQLQSAASLARIPEAQGSIAHVALGELVYHLEFMPKEDRATFIAKTYKQLSPEKKLDLLHFIASVGSDAMAQGWADDLSDSLHEFLDDIVHDDTQSPFIHLAASETLGALRSEAESPTRSVLIHAGDRSVGRRAAASAEIAERSRAIETHITPDDTSYLAGPLDRISRDAIASFDHALVPQSFAFIGPEVDHIKPNTPPSRMIHAVLDALENPQAQSAHILNRIVAFADQRIFSYIPNDPWVKSYWNTQKHHPSDPELLSKLRQQLAALEQRAGYAFIHFELFENFEGNERIMPKGGNEEMDSALLLQEIHRPAIREGLEREMGIPLSDLSLREQVQLLSYLGSVDYATARDGFEAIRRHGLNGARVFLSCEHGRHLGDAILTISEHLSKKDADAVFSAYASIIDLTGQATEDLLKNFFVTDQGKNVDRARINDEILRRGKDILAAFGDRLRSGETITSKEVVAELERFSRDVVLFASLFASVAKGAEIEFSEIRGMLFERTSPERIDEATKRQMMDIAEENWRGQKPVAADWILNGLEQKLSESDGSTTFYTLKREARVIAFIRFDERPDLGPNVLYAASLNVSRELRGSALGEAMLKKTMDHEAREHVIFADAFVDIPAAAFYVENMGLVVTGVEDVRVNANGATETRLLMKRDDAKNSRYALRKDSFTPEKLIAREGRDTRNASVIRFAFPKEAARLAEAVREMSERGFVMTRYVTDPKQPSVRYAVFEPEVES